MSTRKYLGETDVTNMSNNPYSDFSRTDWSLYFIASGGMCDGSWHKKSVLDDVAKILNGVPVVVFLAKWDDGLEEYRPRVSGLPTKKYLKWQKENEYVEGDE